MKRTLGMVLVALAAAGWLMAVPGAQAADPSSGSLSADGDVVTWSGGPFELSNPVACAGELDPLCDHFWLTIGDPGEPFSVSVDLAPAGGGDSFGLSVYNPGGRLVASDFGADGSGGPRHVRIANPAPGTYEVRVQPAAVAPGARYTAVAALAADGSKGRTDQRAAIDVENGLPGSEGCLEPVPGHVGIPALGDRVTLDVLVLLDGIVQSHAEAFVGLAQEYSYGPVGIDINATYEAVSFPADGSHFDDFVTGAERDTIHADTLFQLTKDHVGGVPPAGFDIVYTATAKDIYLPITNEGYGVMGVADCIGGIRYDEFAFVIGEAIDNNDIDLFGVVPVYRDLSAKVFAHEVGHILGAHHHYGQCGPQAANDRMVAQREATACTLMAPFADIISLTFGPVEQVVVRGHADEHAH